VTDWDGLGSQDRQGRPSVEGQWTSQRVRPRAGCGRGARLIQGGCPRCVVSVSTGMQPAGAAMPGSAGLDDCGWLGLAALMAGGRRSNGACDGAEEDGAVSAAYEPCLRSAGQGWSADCY